MKITKDGLYEIEVIMYKVVAKEKYSEKVYKCPLKEDKVGLFFEVKTYKEDKKYYLKECKNKGERK